MADNPATSEGKASAPATDPAVAAALAELAKGQKALTDQIAALAAAQAPPASAAAPAAGATAGAAKALTLDEVSKLLDGKLSAIQQKQTIVSTVRAYITEKMSDLPAFLHRQMPATEDQAQLAAAEQALRAEYKAALEKAGVKPNVNGGTATAGAASVTSAVDLTGKSAEELIALGVADAKVTNAPPTSGTAAAAAA